MESHCEWFRQFFASGRICTSPRYELFDSPAEMPFDTIVLRVLLPMWIIFVPVSACILLFVRATE